MPSNTPRFRKKEMTHSIEQNSGMSEADKQIIGEPVTEFPWDAVPEEMKEFCLVKADLNCNDPVAIFTHIVPTIGVLIGAETWCHSGDGDWYNPPILQTMNVGDPSRGKSTALNLGIYPIKILDAELLKEYQKEYEAWQREYDEANGKEKQRIYENMPIRKECEFQDINYETVVSELSSFQSQLYHVDEGVAFFENLKTGQKDNLTPFNSLWNGECGSSKRKTGKTKVDRFINVNITMGIQPEPLKKYLNEDRIKYSGFIQRFLFYWSDEQLPSAKREYRYNGIDNQRVEDMINEKAKLLVRKQFELRKEYDEKISQGENPWQRLRVLEIKDAARDRLCEFRDAISLSKEYADYGGKVGNIVSRIALILTVFKNPEIENGGLIELTEIECAIKIWKFFYYKYTQLFNSNNEFEKLRSSILNFVEKHIRPTHLYVSEARIWQNFSSRLGKSGKPFFAKAIQSLVDDGLLAVGESKNPRTKLLTIPIAE